MKRAPIVLAGTAAGLVGVLSVHTAATPSAAALASTSSTPAATASASSTSTTSATTPSSTSTTATTTTSTSASRTRTAVGQDVSYQYGDLQVKVTETGHRITSVSVVKLDVTDPRSQQIDSFAVPQLRSEALSAQSAKIDGVSGASYTSAAYAQSLQSALDKLA